MHVPRADGPASRTRYDALVLTGGRASRFGGGDKPGALVGGRSLLERVVTAVAGADRLIIVGDRREIDWPGELLFAREDPPGGGPVPALRAGLVHAAAPWVALLAGDLPFLTALDVEALLAAAGTGAVLVDDTGREQWLAGVWRREVLAGALARYDGRSLHGVLGPLEPALVAVRDRVPWFDCDTADDLAQANRQETA
ncbi:hypothetical protein Acor_26880 [Acrocarpospora corrugata]|uniref:MobA-like NTP transferase domain-containing protein n=1 Tax=Acrocarpospora corrugata TaxID=35763 RepID=A0A5M3VVU8_9ACTN|nr:molybdenum cofactor guanylyltransferase [Acrocarpospora corrugata]GES00624.1 hypothetical protein Acor_26880 [Acrocarpospora corrugata]